MLKKNYLLLVFCCILQTTLLRSQGPTCCCGNPIELNFPGFDFELDPLPPNNDFIIKCNGELGPWAVTAYCIDHCGPFYYNGSVGNPNGPSSFIDLYGGPVGSPSGSATIQYILTGLVTGTVYTLEWWSAKFDVPVSTTIKGNVKIGGGAWLNVSWTATNKGNSIWVKRSYDFLAQASSTTLEFSDDGSISPGWASGMLIDDIKIFGCPDVDHDDPIVTNPPVDLTVNCIQDVPKAPTLDVLDNCDLHPIIKFKESKMNFSPCIRILREWTITDACGNSTTEDQFIDVIDSESPIIANPPQNLTVNCENDVPKVLKLNATDNCEANPFIVFEETIEITDACNKKVIRKWTVTDACSNSIVHTQTIDIIDLKPEVKNPPENIEVECDKDIPPVPILVITDNCSVKVTVDFTEKTIIIDECNKVINRVWSIRDACGNITTEDQVINVMDNKPPDFVFPPENKTVNCGNDPLIEFDQWIRNRGNAVATDACDIVEWRIDYSRLPKSTCDTVIVEFIVIDHCKNERSAFANFIVKDSTGPAFLVQAQNKNLICIPNPEDSLRVWLDNFGFSQVSSACDTLIMSSDFNGDYTVNPLTVIFYARDRCGNSDSSVATFSYRSSNDTLRVKEYSCVIPQNFSDTISYNVNNCDSIVIREHIKLLPDSIYKQSHTCNPLQPRFDTMRLVNSSGCDSLVFNEYIFHSTPQSIVKKQDCSYTVFSADTVIWPGQFCDSFAITEYIPLSKNNNTIIRNTCDSAKTDTTVLSLINQFGCDSIVSIYTIYSPQQFTFIEKKICGLSQSYSDTLKLSTGFCDSLIITTYTSLRTDTAYIMSFTCDKSEAGIFSKKLLNVEGCDSLVITEIFYNKPDSLYITNTSCIAADSGVHIQYLKNRFGCDSTIQLTTQFIPADTTRITGTTCDKASAGTQSLVIKSSPCDSVVFITTVFIPADSTIISRQSCIPSESGSVTTLLKNHNGCDSLLLINTAYVPLHLNFELDSISCYNQQDGNFRILNLSDFSNSFELFLNNTNLGTQNNLEDLSPGTYEIYIHDKNGCISDSVEFNLINPTALNIDLGNDILVDPETDIFLKLKSNRQLQFIYWNPSDLTTCNNCDQINFKVDKDTWVFTQVVDDRNCTQTDSVYIRIKESGHVYAPNSFTPNGDNINDQFIIYGPDNATIETLSIYDRWGELVFETAGVPVNQATYGWNGSFNSEKLNPAVFVYYARIRLINNELLELKGDLTLIR